LAWKTHAGRIVVSVHRKWLGGQIYGMRAKRDCRDIFDNDHLKEAAVCLRRTLMGFEWIQDTSEGVAALPENGHKTGLQR
jgi:hypothetical protein